MLSGWFGSLVAGERWVMRYISPFRSGALELNGQGSVVAGAHKVSIVLLGDCVGTDGGAYDANYIYPLSPKLGFCPECGEKRYQASV